MGYPWTETKDILKLNTRGIPVARSVSYTGDPWVPILTPVLTGIIGLIKFDSEFMRNENFRKITNYENLRGSG